MKITQKRLIGWAILMFFLLPIEGMAGMRELQTPAEISKDLDYLLSFVGPERASPKGFKPDRIAAVLKFVLSPKQPGILYYPDDISGIPSTYFEIDVSRSLEQILRLTDNPQVPAVFTAPSTVRSARWMSVDTPNRKRPMLWEQVSNLHAPVSFSGVEHLVNTPDQTTGAYYEYDLDRTVILTKADGHNLLISLSRQQGLSDSGKKGLIIGQDSQWDYFYTGQSGLNRMGLGWVDSYLYDSYSVAFYLEGTGTNPSVRFGVFKWVKAGWSNINFVKRPHIHEGLQRFAEVFKQIVENPRLAEGSGWYDTLIGIQGFGTDRLRQIVQEYLGALQQQVESEDTFPAEDVKTWFKDGGYLKTLNREEMQSIVVLEYLKHLLGKQAKVNLRQVLAGSSE